METHFAAVWTQKIRDSSSVHVSTDESGIQTSVAEWAFYCYLACELN